MVTDKPLTYEEVLLPPSLFTQRRRQRLPFGDLLRRGWAFLRGDAYVNVFHDLRRQRPDEPYLLERRVTVSPGGITITQSDGVDHHYRYPEINALQLNQYAFKQQRSNYATPYNRELTELVFEARKDNYRIYLPRTINDFVRLWMSLERWGGFSLTPRNELNAHQHRRGTRGTESYYRVVRVKTHRTAPSATPPAHTMPPTAVPPPDPAVKAFDHPLMDRPGGVVNERERLIIEESGLTLHRGTRSKLTILPYTQLTKLHLIRHVVRRFNPQTQHLIDTEAYFELLYCVGSGERRLYFPTEIKDMSDLHFTLEKWTGHKFQLLSIEPAVTHRYGDGVVERHARTEYHLRITP